MRSTRDWNALRGGGDWGAAATTAPASTATSRQKARRIVRQKNSPDPRGPPCHSVQLPEARLHRLVCLGFEGAPPLVAIRAAPGHLVCTYGDSQVRQRHRSGRVAID